MPPKITTREETRVVSTRTKLETIALGDGLNAFRISTTQKRDSRDGDLRTTPVKTKPSVSEGLIMDDQLENMVAGKKWAVADTFWMLGAEGRERIRQEGLVPISEASRKSRKTAIHQDVFTALCDGRLSADDVIRVDRQSHFSYTKDGKALPMGVLFDYISNGRISNLTYDLPVLIDHLLGRGDVSFFAHEKLRDDHVNHERFATTPEEALLSVPGYNQDEGQTKTVMFLWAPSQEDYQRVHDEVIREDDPRRRDLHKAIFDLDMLGLRACGAALCDTYYADAPAPEDEDFGPC